MAGLERKSVATLEGKPMAGLAKSSMTKLDKIPTDEEPEPPSAVAISFIKWYAARRRKWRAMAD